MQESFRRAFRKFTGRSVVELKASHHRLQMLEKIGLEFDPNYTILLKENLDQIKLDPSHPRETVSESSDLNQKSSGHFRKLSNDVETQFLEFRQKWAQRYEVDEFVERLENGSWLLEEPQGFKVNVGTKAKDLKDFYLHDMHLMVGDAEKLIVTTSSRCLKIQNKICKDWYEEMRIRGESEVSMRPISRLLPTLELGLRDMEGQEFRKIRDSIKLLAEKRFRDGIKRAGSHHYRSPQAAYRNLGGSWNNLGIWNSGFRAYMEDFVDFCLGICLEIIEWYRKKWTLFTRGWSRGQIELFDQII